MGVRGPAFTAAAVVATFLSLRTHALELDRALRGATVAAKDDIPAAAPAPLALRLSDRLARTAAARRYPRSTQPLIVTLIVNADPKGEKIARITESGEFLLRREDLEEVATIPGETSAYEIEGETFVELRAIASAKVLFNEKTLDLELKFPPEGFPRQRFDLATRLAAVDLESPPRSALLNYRLGYAGTRGAQGNLSLSAEAAVSRGGWLVRSQSFHSLSADDSSSVRLETQAIRDDRENLRRLTLGDSITPGLVLGSSVPFAGITYAKAYALSPYFTRQPSVGFRGLAEFPSQVDFYVGNTLVMRQRVAPGPFDIQNFTYYGGQRDVRVVVRDVFGREQSIAYPFYFASQGLAAGLHDYSYQAGWLRHGLGAESNDYGRFALSAFHQYGLTDSWTFGARAEGTASMANAGTDVFYRSEWLGVWALHAAASRDRDRERSGHAVSVSQGFLRGEISTQVIAQAFSRDYSILATDIMPRLPKRDFSASVAYATPAIGSLSLGFTRLELYGEPVARSLSATYSKPLFGWLNVMATLRRQLSEPRGTEVFIGLQYLPRPSQSANLSWNRDIHGVRTTSLQWGNQVPAGEGLAYSLNVQRQETGEDTTHLVAPRLEWHTRVGTLGAEVTHLAGAASGSSTGYALSLSGALVAADGRFALSRPVADSFAIVEIEPALAGVLVYENSQEIGRTDARGRVLLPNIASYANNYASLRDKDVPIEYAIEKVGKSFSPPFRSGTLVPFHIEQLRTFTGRLQYRTGAQVRPLEYHLVAVEAAGRAIEVPTGKNGDFYIENLPAGRHRASVQIRGSRCEFAIDVPATVETAVALGDIMTCHVAP